MSELPEYPSIGELLVRNGKQRGVRLPLRHPLTLIGSGDGCDIRLTAESVGAIHCAIVPTPGGPTFRAVGDAEVLLNGTAHAEALLTDGDEVKVGPCVFQVCWLPWAEPTPAETLPAEASQIADILDERQRQLAEQDEQLAMSRAAFRRERDAERDQLHRDREQVEHLKREVKTLHREAIQERERVRKLAPRFVRQVQERWATTRTELETRQVTLDEYHGQLTAEFKRFESARHEIHANAVAARDRLREDWAALDAQRKRFATERAESDDFFSKQEAMSEARASELAARQMTLSGEKAKIDRETATLRREAAGLDSRIEHGRAIVAELEQKREALQAELLAMRPKPVDEPPEPLRVALDRHQDRDLHAWAHELDAQEAQLNQDRAALAAVKAALERQNADLRDERRVLAEQVAQLAAARAQWQETERQTVDEMEELARGLSQRERTLCTREQRLIRADVRRREDGYDLWQLRLRLEAWQARLLTVESRWHTERESREAEYARGVQRLMHRESHIEAAFARWEHARRDEGERLRTEVQFWANDRARLVEATAEYDRRAREVVGELMTHAARALASEELVTETMAQSGSDRVTRRLGVLRKRWEKEFSRRVKEIDEQRTAAAADRERLDERYRELQQFAVEVTDREAEVNSRLARADAEAAMADDVPAEMTPVTRPDAESAELVALREEVERLAAVLLATRLVEVPDLPDSELPWSWTVEEASGSERPDVLPFAAARAA